MTIGFRATGRDVELISRLAHSGESPSEVLHRALKALEQVEWERDAQSAALHIMASGENLGDEPGAW